jgi:hypothetical protein
MMAVLDLLYRNGLLLSVPSFCLGAALLGRSILSIIRTVGTAELARLPLAEKQTVTLNQAGPVVLCVEGPRMATRFSGLSYELAAENGAFVRLRTTWFHATTSGFSTVRREERRLDIPGPGNYTLRVSGLGTAEEGDANLHLVFVKPHSIVIVLYILGIILSAGLTVGSLVLFILRLAGGENGP